MATTAIWKVKGNLGRVVGYAANPDKTENPAFTAQDLQGLRDVMDYATQDGAAALCQRYQLRPGDRQG